MKIRRPGYPELEIRASVHLGQKFKFVPETGIQISSFQIPGSPDPPISKYKNY